MNVTINSLEIQDLKMSSSMVMVSSTLVVAMMVYIVATVARLCGCEAGSIPPARVVRGVRCDENEEPFIPTTL